MLDIECFTYLHRALESPISPIVVFATNRGVTTVRGTESVLGAQDGIRAPHGMPVDLLDRLMIIKTAMYSAEELKEIAKLRSKAEGVDLTQNGLDKLGEIGKDTSLRYTCQLLTPAKVIAMANGKEQVDVDDIIEAADLFMDSKKISRIIQRKRSELKIYCLKQNISKFIL